MQSCVFPSSKPPCSRALPCTDPGGSGTVVPGCYLPDSGKQLAMTIVVLEWQLSYDNGGGVKVFSSWSLATAPVRHSLLMSCWACRVSFPGRRYTISVPVFVGRLWISFTRTLWAFTKMSSSVLVMRIVSSHLPCGMIHMCWWSWDWPEDCLVHGDWLP